MVRYRILKDDRVLGPFEAREIVGMPGYSPRWLVRRAADDDGTPADDWRPASEIPELRAPDEDREPALIMAVDDDPSVRRILGLRLENKGYRLELYENGPDALAALARPGRRAPDLIICDVMMPGMDGFEVCRRVRAAGARMPFLFLTNRGSTQDKVRGLETGADDYILKPFDPHELEAKVARHLKVPPRP